MIYDSEIWKNDLETEYNILKDFFKKLNINYDNAESEDDFMNGAFIRLQKFSIYSSIVIRKLIEADKISDEMLRHCFPIKIYAKIGSETVTRMNDHKIDELYDLDNPKKGNISVKDLIDQFIHSYHFIPEYEWEKIDESSSDEESDWKVKNLKGLNFSSNKTKDTHLSFIEFKSLMNFISKILKDFIVSIKYVNGKIIEKSSKIIPLSIETREILKKSE